MHIQKAEENDLKAILDLQYLACQSEAQLLGNPDIPSLKQAFEQVQQEFRKGIFLKAVNQHGKIIGSVRGYADGDTLFIGKLMVHPGYQGNGIGTRLLGEIEKECARPRYVLYTSDKSKKTSGFMNALTMSRSLNVGSSIWKNTEMINNMKHRRKHGGVMILGSLT